MIDLTEQKVSASEFFSLLFLSVLSTVFMYISSPQIPIARTEALLRPVVFIIISLVAGLPAFFIYINNVKNARKGLVVKETKFLRIATSGFGAVYFVGALKTILRFDLFASSELFPGNDMSIFLIAIVVVCGALSTVGLSAICRGSVIFCFIVVGATFFVMVSLVDEFRLLNFTPLFSDGIGEFAKDSFLFTIQATEIGAVTLFLPRIKGEFKKHYISFVTLSGLAFTAILAFVIGTLGSFADTQLFPTYTAVTLANFGLLERIDALETAIWILCVVVKISFYILIVVQSLKKLLPKFSIRVLTVAVCTALAVIPAVISNNIEAFGFISNNVLTFVLYVVGVVILPCVLLVYYRKVRPYEKFEEDI